MCLFTLVSYLVQQIDGLTFYRRVTISQSSSCHFQVAKSPISVSKKLLCNLMTFGKRSIDNSPGHKTYVRGISRTMSALVIRLMCVVYQALCHAPKPSQMSFGHHAPHQFKQRDLDVQKRDYKNGCNYMKMTFICFIGNPNSTAFFHKIKIVFSS